MAYLDTKMKEFHVFSKKQWVFESKNLDLTKKCCIFVSDLKM